MVASSFAPMRRVRISSLPAAVSKRQPLSVFTSGIGSGQSSLPVSRTIRSSPDGTSLCASS